MKKYILALLMTIVSFGEFPNEAVSVDTQQQNVLMIKVNDKYYYSDGKWIVFEKQNK